MCDSYKENWAMKHVRMTHNGRGPPNTYYYLEWMYDQMRHGDYGTLVSEFIGKCLMTFRPKLWNEHEREVYDNNNDVVCGIYCIAGYVCALLFMPSLKVAMFIWGLCCAIDNIGWLVVYHKNKDKFTEDKNN